MFTWIKIPSTLQTVLYFSVNMRIMGICEKKLKIRTGCFMNIIIFLACILLLIIAVVAVVVSVTAGAVGGVIAEEDDEE